MGKIKGWRRLYSTNTKKKNIEWENDINYRIHAGVYKNYRGDDWRGLVAEFQEEYSYESTRVILDINGKKENVMKEIIKYMKSHPKG